MAISRTDEQAILEKYQELRDAEQARLDDAESRVAECRKAVESLDVIVRALEARIGDGVAGVAPSSDGHGSAASVPTPSPTMRLGAPSLTARVREVMADGVPRSVGDVLDALNAKAAPEHGTAVTRQKLANRLVELAQQGYLQRRERGVYQLASQEAPENGVGREGPNLSAGLEGPNLLAFSGVQKPPDEEVIAPRLGHPV